MRAIPAGEVLTELTIATRKVVRDELLPTPMNDEDGPTLATRLDDQARLGQAGLGQVVSERDAFAEGFEAGRREAETLAQAKLEHEIALREQAIEQARVSWSNEESQVLARALATALEDLRTDVCESVADILQPFVEEELLNRAVADMSGILADVLRGDGTMQVEVRARGDFLEALRMIEPFSGPNFHMVPSDSNEFVCRVGDLQLKTQVELWRSGLTEAAE